MRRDPAIVYFYYTMQFVDASKGLWLSRHRRR